MAREVPGALQPTLSRKVRAMLADVFGSICDICEEWKTDCVWVDDLSDATEKVACFDCVRNESRLFPARADHRPLKRA